MEHLFNEHSRVALRPVQPDDEDFLLRVYASSRADELAQVSWAEGQQEAFLRHQFDAQREQYAARFPDAQYDIILFDGVDAGRFWIGRSRDEIRLLDIAILPEYQNRGVGATLLEALMSEAEAAGKRLRHMVFKLNTAGLRFYERLGFTPIEDTGMYLHMEWRPASLRATSAATSSD